MEVDGGAGRISCPVSGWMRSVLGWASHDSLTTMKLPCKAPYRRPTRHLLLVHTRYNGTHPRCAPRPINTESVIMPTSRCLKAVRARAPCLAAVVASNHLHSWRFSHAAQSRAAHRHVVAQPTGNKPLPSACSLKRGTGATARRLGLRSSW